MSAVPVGRVKTDWNDPRVLGHRAQCLNSQRFLGMEQQSAGESEGDKVTEKEKKTGPWREGMNDKQMRFMEHRDGRPDKTRGNRAPLALIRVGPLLPLVSWDPRCSLRSSYPQERHTWWPSLKIDRGCRTFPRNQLNKITSQIRSNESINSCNFTILIFFFHMFSLVLVYPY